VAVGNDGGKWRDFLCIDRANSSVGDQIVTASPKFSTRKATNDIICIAPPIPISRFAMPITNRIVPLCAKVELRGRCGRGNSPEARLILVNKQLRLGR
jgi:hypothetical protein